MLTGDHNVRWQGRVRVSSSCTDNKTGPARWRCTARCPPIYGTLAAAWHTKLQLYKLLPGCRTRRHDLASGAHGPRGDAGFTFTAVRIRYTAVYVRRRGVSRQY